MSLIHNSYKYAEQIFSCKKKKKTSTTKYHHFHHQIRTTNTHNQENKTQTGYRNKTKEKEGGRRIDRSLRSFKPLQPTTCHHSQIKTNVPNKNRRTKQGSEREDKPEPSPTVVVEPDQIVLSGRRAITLLPPSQSRVPPYLPLAAPPSLSGTPPPLSLSPAVSPSLSRFWLRFLFSSFAL
jgi:hypothetical protein